MADAIRYHATARNFAAGSENPVHGEEATQFGFASPVVSGAAIFGHMTYPLVRSLGEDWLASYATTVRFRRPAYDGDSLTMEHAANGDTHEVRCLARGEPLAELHSTPMPAGSSPPTPPPQAVPSQTQRAEFSWHDLPIGVSFPAWTWQPDPIANAEAAAQVEDDLPCYEAGLLHPHAILNIANQAFTRHYRMPPWLHVQSRIRSYRALRVGDLIEVRATPVRKWRHRGRTFVELKVACLVEGAVATAMLHRALVGTSRDA